jgi:hypothetical protein
MPSSKGTILEIYSTLYKIFLLLFNQVFSLLFGFISQHGAGQEAIHLGCCTSPFIWGSQALVCLTEQHSGDTTRENTFFIDSVLWRGCFFCDPLHKNNG